MSTIDCFVPCVDESAVSELMLQFNGCPLVNNVYLLAKEPFECGPEAVVLKIDTLSSANTVKMIAETATADYVMLCTKDTPLELGQFALDRMARIARDTGASMIYSDYYKIVNGLRSTYPVNDYQQGSLRDDFNFGSVWLISSAELKKAAGEMNTNYLYAGLYDLRLDRKSVV